MGRLCWLLGRMLRSRCRRRWPVEFKVVRVKRIVLCALRVPNHRRSRPLLIDSVLYKCCYHSHVRQTYRSDKAE